MASDFKKNKCKIISITNKSVSTLSKLSDYSVYLIMSLDHDMGNHINTTTQIPVIYLIEAIGRRPVKYSNFIIEKLLNSG